MVMNTWQLQQAKSRFSELVDTVIEQGPQSVTRHGHEAVVVVSSKDYRRLSGQAGSLVTTLLNAPRGAALNIQRSKEKIRDVGL
jgi:prevent-host-death family protein